MLLRKIVMPHYQALLLAVLLLALSGCAAIVKGSKSPVRLEVPLETDIQNYSGYDATLTLKGGERRLELTAGENYLVEYQVGTYRDSMLLQRKLNWLYILADFYLVFPVSLAIDLNGAAYEFDKDFIAFPPPPDSLSTTASRPILNIYAFDDRQGYTHSPLGIVLMGHLGSRLPYNQVPLLGNNSGLAIGYRIIPKLVLMGYYGGSGLMDYAPANSSIYMEASVITYALEARYHLTRVIYGSVGLEHLTIYANELRLTDRTPWGRVRGFSDAMVGASVGAGMAFQGFFFEARQHWGFERVQIREGITQRVSNFAIRFGVNVEF